MHHPSPPEYHNKDIWSISREISLAKAVSVTTDPNFREHNLMLAANVPVSSCECGRPGNLVIAKIYSWSSVREFPCVGSRYHEGRQKAMRRYHGSCRALNHGRGKHLILRLEGAWSTFVDVRSCAFGLDQGSHLLAVRCGFFDSISHSISPAWKALTISVPDDLHRQR